MAINPDFKTIKEKRLDKETTLKIKKNLATGRIFVEFTANNPRMVLQKNFQDSMAGRNESETFAKSIKNIDQLREYFGLNKEAK